MASMIGRMGLLGVVLGFCAVVSSNAQTQTGGSAEKGGPAARRVRAEQRVSVGVARDRAKLLHEVYASTLEVMHQRYFQGDKSPVPARVMEDVFGRVRREYKIEARWIAVNLSAMSIDNEPQTEFEKQAAREISAGKSEFEVVQDGFYRRAGVIHLDGGCLRCHGAFLTEPAKSAKYAGLVINVPLLEEPAGK